MLLKVKSPTLETLSHILTANIPANIDSLENLRLFPLTPEICQYLKISQLDKFINRFPSFLRKFTLVAIFLQLYLIPTTSRYESPKKTDARALYGGRSYYRRYSYVSSFVCTKENLGNSERMYKVRRDRSILYDWCVLYLASQVTDLCDDESECF